MPTVNRPTHQYLGELYIGDADRMSATIVITLGDKDRHVATH